VVGQELHCAMIKQSTIYSSNILLVFNCRYRLRAAPGAAVRGMSSLGQTLARHLLR